MVYGSYLKKKKKSLFSFLINCSFYSTYVDILFVYYSLKQWIIYRVVSPCPQSEIMILQFRILCAQPVQSLQWSEATKGKQKPLLALLHRDRDVYQDVVMEHTGWLAPKGQAPEPCVWLQAPLQRCSRANMAATESSSVMMLIMPRHFGCTHFCSCHI